MVMHGCKREGKARGVGDVDGREERNMRSLLGPNAID
jgi:hypothetical protein